MSRRPIARPPDLATRILRGDSVPQIAEQEGCDRRVVRRWFDDPETQAEVAELRAAGVEAQARKVGYLVTAALRVLGELVENPKTPAAVRRQAASDLLDRYGQATRQEVRVTEGRSAEELARLAETLRERAASLGGGDSDGETE